MKRLFRKVWILRRGKNPFIRFQITASLISSKSKDLLQEKSKRVENKAVRLKVGNIIETGSKAGSYQIILFSKITI